MADHVRHFYKDKPGDKIWMCRTVGVFRGCPEFSFDRETVYNLFRDYPDRLSAYQKELFDKEQPYWAEFMRHRLEDH